MDKSGDYDLELIEYTCEFLGIVPDERSLQPVTFSFLINLTVDQVFSNIPDLGADVLISEFYRVLIL